ncbi:MAG: ribosome biogenesis GTPase Der [Candidatus Sumerlaeia bacterium]|nr:ribosome biogenesis GTPase Der [Candidatus Sumerlaeia bacterium]
MALPTPLVAIVGRPNVGKSTLFNRILGQRKAIVHEQPGLTRDRHYGNARYQEKDFILIDTGGYEDDINSPLLKLMREQTLIAIDQADAIILLMEEAIFNDPIDAEILDRLRASKKPFYLAVNKADDNKRYIQAIADFSAHGLDVFPVSALHGNGVYDLLDEVTKDFPITDGKPHTRLDGPIRVALVGRQNVGKSTLTNRLLGEERMIASDVAGTTRDSIDSNVKVHGQEFVLIDTAGIRRRGKIERGPEKLSVHSSFRAIDRCDVALLIIDIAEGISAQDTHVAGYILERNKACMIVLNKWDKVTDKEKYGEYINKVREEFSFLKWAPMVTISAMTGQRAYKLWALIQACAVQYRRQFTTRALNEVLYRAVNHLSPPIYKNRIFRIKYMTQTGFCPPTFTFFVNDPECLHFSYERYLHNQFRQHLGLMGTPIKFRFKRKAVEGNWDPTIRALARGEELTTTSPHKNELYDPNTGELRAVSYDLGEEYEADVEMEDGEELESEGLIFADAKGRIKDELPEWLDAAELEEDLEADGDDDEEWEDEEWEEDEVEEDGLEEDEEEDEEDEQPKGKPRREESDGLY